MYDKWKIHTVIQIIEEEQVKNAKINFDDVKKADKILGKATAEIRGKMRRRSPRKHKTRTQGELPDHLKGKEIEMYIDVFVASKCLFLIKKEGKVEHFKAIYLKNKKMSNISKIIQEEIKNMKIEDSRLLQYMQIMPLIMIKCKK